MTFKPGVSGNPAGNPAWKKGIKSPNPKGRERGNLDGKRTQQREQEALVAMAQFAATEQRSFVDILRDFADDPTIKPGLRIAAAAAGAKYDPQFLHSIIEVPAFGSVPEAETFLLELSRREGRRELDSKSVAIISARTQAWIDNQRADDVSQRADTELELKRIAASDTGDQHITISGGLPSLPGCNVMMPQLDGRAAPGLLEQEAAVQATNGAAISDQTSQARASSPKEPGP
jgi:hypothetical protein